MLAGRPEVVYPNQQTMPYRQQVAEGAEPVPFNRSQMLYNNVRSGTGMPVHQATVTGAESLQRPAGFEQYVDVHAAQNRENEKLQYGIQPFQAQETGAPVGIGATQTQQRLAANGNTFDRSLNDRDPHMPSMTPTQLMASAA